MTGTDPDGFRGIRRVYPGRPGTAAEWTELFRGLVRPCGTKSPTAPEAGGLPALRHTPASPASIPPARKSVQGLASSQVRAARHACARWLTRFFSSADSSAKLWPRGG